MEALTNAVVPHLLEILSIILTAILGWAAAAARRKWGIDIAAGHREAFHSALMTAARLAVANQLTGQQAIAMILDYARQSVPDAIEFLRPTIGVSDDLARSKLVIAEVEAALAAKPIAVAGLASRLRPVVPTGSTEFG